MSLINNKSEINIAYLAPEIPALSATFVYQEILQLEKMGLRVKPVSIHRPINKALSNELESLEERTFYLYEQTSIKVITSNIVLFLSSPLKYFSTLITALSDVCRVGIFNRLGAGIIYRFFIAAGFVHYLQKNKIDHIHSNFAHIPTDITMYAASLHGITFSFISHANDLFERGWLLKEKVARAKFAVTISEYNKHFLTELGAAKDKISVIHCGVDTACFSDRGYKELSTPPLFGALGRMVEKKGFDVLIEACAILKKESFSFKLQLAGGGPLKEELEKLALSYNLNKEIVFIDAIAHQNVPKWIKTLDIFVLPCQKDSNGDMDGIPVVLMEAMLSGVPVISTCISGIPELIEDNLTGFLCNPKDAECLASTIKRMINQSVLVEELKKNAILKVKAGFELRDNISLLVDKLKS